MCEKLSPPQNEQLIQAGEHLSFSYDGDMDKRK